MQFVVVRVVSVGVRLAWIGSWEEKGKGEEREEERREKRRHFCHCIFAFRPFDPTKELIVFSFAGALEAKIPLIFDRQWREYR